MQLMQRVPRLLQGARRALRVHREMLEDEIASLEARAIASVSLSAPQRRHSDSDADDADDEGDF